MKSATRKSRKPSAEELARNSARESRLAAIGQAISERRAYLKTYGGNRLVVGYRSDTGWAVTNNTGSSWDQQSFMVCEESIKIAAEPILVERRVVRELAPFLSDGKLVSVTESAIEKTWHWPEE